jgi:hypothetical protein
LNLNIPACALKIAVRQPGQLLATRLVPFHLLICDFTHLAPGFSKPTLPYLLATLRPVALATWKIPNFTSGLSGQYCIGNIFFIRIVLDAVGFIRPE